ncbi:hypothetical protein GCM10010319_26630 [Streptomyces blastmyceticus]|uniref:Uncharacterized protein n=1 Tax=Streptomyces blastmyceticus TaxID=68180 RepID=A0ABN0WXK1_9ACTN
MVGGPSGVAGGGETDPRLPEFPRHREGPGGGRVADEPFAGGAVQRAERQGDVEAVAGAQGPSEGRGGQSQLEEERGDMIGPQDVLGAVDQYLDRLFTLP